jgi:hypothetical protein
MKNLKLQFKNQNYLLSAKVGILNFKLQFCILLFEF